MNEKESKEVKEKKEQDIDKNEQKEIKDAEIKEKIEEEIKMEPPKKVAERPKKQKGEDKFVKLFFTVVFGVVVGLIIVISILKWTPILSMLESTVNTESDGKIVTNTSKNTVYEKSSLAAAIENVYDSEDEIMFVLNPMLVREETNKTLK